MFSVVLAAVLWLWLIVTDRALCLVQSVATRTAVLTIIIHVLQFHFQIRFDVFGTWELRLKKSSARCIGAIGCRIVTSSCCGYFVKTTYNKSGTFCNCRHMCAYVLRLANALGVLFEKSSVRSRCDIFNAVYTFYVRLGVRTVTAWSLTVKVCCHWTSVVVHGRFPTNCCWFLAGDYGFSVCWFAPRFNITGF